MKLRQYKGDLQVSCLQAVMATPVIVLEPLLQLIAPTLQVSLNICEKVCASFDGGRRITCIAFAV